MKGLLTLNRKDRPVIVLNQIESKQIGIVQAGYCSRSLNDKSGDYYRLSQGGLAD